MLAERVLALAFGLLSAFFLHRNVSLSRNLNKLTLTLPASSDPYPLALPPPRIPEIPPDFCINTKHAQSLLQELFEPLSMIRPDPSIDLLMSNFSSRSDYTQRNGVSYTDDDLTFALILSGIALTTVVSVLIIHLLDQRRTSSELETLRAQVHDKQSEIDRFLNQPDNVNLYNLQKDRDETFTQLLVVQNKLVDADTIAAEAQELVKQLRVEKEKLLDDQGDWTQAHTNEMQQLREAQASQLAEKDAIYNKMLAEKEAEKRAAVNDQRNLSKAVHDKEIKHLQSSHEKDTESLKRRDAEATRNLQKQQQTYADNLSNRQSLLDQAQKEAAEMAVRAQKAESQLKQNVAAKLKGTEKITEQEASLKQKDDELASVARRSSVAEAQSNMANNRVTELEQKLAQAEARARQAEAQVSRAEALHKQAIDLKDQFEHVLKNSIRVLPQAPDVQTVPDSTAHTAAPADPVRISLGPATSRADSKPPASTVNRDIKSKNTGKGIQDSKYAVPSTEKSVTDKVTMQPALPVSKPDKSTQAAASIPPPPQIIATNDDAARGLNPKAPGFVWPKPRTTSTVDTIPVARSPSAGPAATLPPKQNEPEYDITYVLPKVIPPVDEFNIPMPKVKSRVEDVPERFDPTRTQPERRIKQWNLKELKAYARVRTAVELNMKDRNYTSVLMWFPSGENKSVQRLQYRKTLKQGYKTEPNQSLRPVPFKTHIHENLPPMLSQYELDNMFEEAFTVRASTAQVRPSSSTFDADTATTPTPVATTTSTEGNSIDPSAPDDDDADDGPRSPPTEEELRQHREFQLFGPPEDNLLNVIRPLIWNPLTDPGMIRDRPYTQAYHQSIWESGVEDAETPVVSPSPLDFESESPDETSFPSPQSLSQPQPQSHSRLPTESSNDNSRPSSRPQGPKKRTFATIASTLRGSPIDNVGDNDPMDVEPTREFVQLAPAPRPSRPTGVTAETRSETSATGPVAIAVSTATPASAPEVTMANTDEERRKAERDADIERRVVQSGYAYQTDIDAQEAREKQEQAQQEHQERDARAQAWARTQHQTQAEEAQAQSQLQTQSETQSEPEASAPSDTEMKMSAAGDSEMGDALMDYMQNN